MSGAAVQAGERSLPRLSKRRFHGRAINAVGETLRRQLTVPEIYLEPRIPGGPVVDVLAVDRGGSGDLHGVLVTEGLTLNTPAQRRSLLGLLKKLPFHYKYVAIPDFAADLQSDSRFAEAVELFDESGIGRIGLLSVNKALFNATAPLNAAMVVQVIAPERFKVSSTVLAPLERFLLKAKPDISVRI
jgi:hypothetical protein